MKHLSDSLENLFLEDLRLQDIQHRPDKKEIQIMSMFLEDMHNKEVLKVAPDTSGADRFFVDEFINGEMSLDFWDIARDFLQHHYPRLKEFNDMAENCVDVPEKCQLGTVLQKRILNMMYNAAKAGDEYCNALMRELYKTYYKKEYKQLKRFRKVSLSELFALSKDEDGDVEYFAMARILGMCAIIGIELEESCSILYILLNKERKSWDEDMEVSYFQFDGELYSACLEQVEEWMDQETERQSFQRAERFAELCLNHNGYSWNYLYMCSRGYAGNRFLFTETLALLKTGFPKKEFTFEEVQIYAMLWLSIDALVSVCSECDENISAMFGTVSDWYENEERKCLFHPENIKVQKPKAEKKQEKPVHIAPMAKNEIKEADYLEEIRQLRSRLQEKEQECKYYRQQYDQTKTALHKAEEIIKKNENDRAELIALRNYAYHLSTESPVVMEETQSVEDMKNYIAERKIIIIGGHVNWINKLKKEFPKWKYLDANVTRSNHSETFEDVEKVYFYTDHLSHGTYGRFIAMAREKNLFFGYLHTINMTALIRQIYEELK